MIFWKKLIEILLAEHKLYLLTVIQNSGSSPGRKGFKMLVAANGYIYGSIGGGVMEHRLVEYAKEQLSQNNLSVFFKKQLHKGAKKDASGMICSGEQTVVFHPLVESDAPQIRLLISLLKKNNPVQLILTPNKFTIETTNVLNSKFECVIDTVVNWKYSEQLELQQVLYIVGGGHVGLAVSELFTKMGFYVVVFDNRDHINTFQQNAFAHEKHLISYENIEKYIPEKQGTYVVIMTNKYTDDKLVLSKLLKKGYHYLGVLGSKAKLNVMWEVLLNEGFSIDELNKVYAPIGIPIKSETPYEIAVSIAAQVIAIKNKPTDAVL